MFDNFEKLKNYLANPAAELKEGNFTPTPLAEHDKQFHPHGYKPGDKCAFRKAAAKLDAVDMLLDPINESVDSNSKDAPTTTLPKCPLINPSIMRCDFATKSDRKENLQMFLSAYTQSDTKGQMKLCHLLDGQFSSCALLQDAQEIFNALNYGVPWDRFKTLNQQQWVKIAAVAKCLLGLNAESLEKIFNLRERIVTRRVQDDR